MIKLLPENGGIVFGDVTINAQTRPTALDRRSFIKSSDFKPPYQSYKTVNFIEYRHHLFGIRLVFKSEILERAIIYCGDNRSWENVSLETPLIEEKIMHDLIATSYISEFTDYPWGRAYVFQDRKNLSCNLYIEYIHY